MGHFKLFLVNFSYFFNYTFLVSGPFIEKCVLPPPFPSTAPDNTIGKSLNKYIK